MIRGIEVVSKENVKLENDDVKQVKVGWRNWGDMNNRMVFLNGKDANYQVRRVAGVFDGIMNINDPKVCVQRKPGIKSTKVRGIKVGDVIGSIWSVVDVDHDLSTNNADVFVTGMNEEWTYETLRNRVRLREDMSVEDRRRVYNLLYERRNVLSRDDDDIGETRLPEFKIVLKDDTPIYQRPRHFPLPVMKEIEQQCEELERIGVLEQSESPWNSPVVPIRKPDGSLRICIDYRKVNDATVKDRFPMCLVSECVYSMYGMKVFTKLDLVRGYYQMPIEGSSRPITAFSTARSHYQFKRLSFGLANAPAAFQRGMNVALKKFPCKNVLVFIDDILIMNESMDEHMKLVMDVLTTLEEIGIKVKVTKCEWFEKEVEFLGHRISENGLRKSEKFLEKVRNFPRPKTVKELKGFLGLVEFQRKFVKGCSGIAKPLTVWTGRKNSCVLKWDEGMNEAFERLKEMSAEDSQIAYPDYGENSRPLELYTDASGYCMGGCLIQEQLLNGEWVRRVIGYVSKAFNKAERKYSTIERELAAIRFCVKTLKAFLYGVRFVIKTDHQPLVYLQRMKCVDSRIARTLEDLSDFDYMVEYTPGERNGMADLMSRFPGVERLGMNEVIDPEYLPKGVMKGRESKGGGDSLFVSVWYGLKDLMNDGLEIKLPETINELRKVVMCEVCKRPEAIGVSKVKRYVKELKAMCIPGVMPFQEVLMVVSKIFRVIVYVHYGAEIPIIYKDERVKGKNTFALHLQCVGGIHYNWVIEKKSYERCSESRQDSVEDEPFENMGECRVELVQSMEEAVSLESLGCQHGLQGKMKVKVHIDGVNFCGLIDTGAQVSLVNECVVNEVIQKGENIEYKDSRIRITGIGEGQVLAWKQVRLKIMLGSDLEVEQEFIVLGKKDMPYCFLFGVDFLRLNHFSVDVGNKSLNRGENVLVRLQHENVNMLNFVGLIEIGMNDKNRSELLNEEDIEEMQNACPVVRELRKCVLSRICVQEWPSLLRDLKSYADRLLMCEGLLYFKKKLKDENVWVPVMSLVGMIGLVLIFHNRLGHLGKNKLWECMKERVFHPSLLKVVYDVCTTCEECQKRKFQSMSSQPPIVKIDAREPFELVAIDCVSLPVSARGHVGMVVMVDHKSKFAYAVPVKNKRSGTIADAIRMNVLPMCVCKPKKCLSDNGPEFLGKEFEYMLKENEIEHILTTPYMPSSNGLAERTIKTLCEMLRTMCKSMKDWDLYIGRVLWAYNMTVHRATGLSPCMYVLNFEKLLRPRLNLGMNERELWRAGNRKFRTYEVGEKVLKCVNEIGRLNVYKLKEKFEGPYVIKKVRTNGVSYVLERLNDKGILEECRAHHRQLREWREPPQYLKDHPVYDVCKTRLLEDVREWEECQCWKDKELVLVEKKRKKRKNGGKLVETEKLCGETERELWWDDTNGSGIVNKTFSICNFPLNERSVAEECVVSLLKSMRDEFLVGERSSLSEFCEQLSELIEEMKNLSGFKEHKVSLNEDENLMAIEEVRKLMVQSEEENGHMLEGTERRTGVRPKTRSQGKTEDHDWVLGKAIEHGRKGRPKGKGN